MNKLQAYGLLAGLGLWSAAFAQAQQATQDPMPSTTPAEGTAADRTAPGKTPTSSMSTEGNSATQPSTAETEGTAADRSPPGKTQTAPMAGAETTVSPQPSTSPTEGTAADRTAPGKTPTRTAEASGTRGKEMMGANVVSSDQAPLGTVADVTLDAAGQPEFVVIAVQGQETAVPYRTASSMMSGNKLVMDRSRLQGAPKIKQGERRGGSTAWKNDASQYWNER
jgi:PRC-barrel domain